MQLFVLIGFLAFCAFIAKAPRPVIAMVMAIVFLCIVLYGVVDVGQLALKRL